MNTEPGDTYDAILTAALEVFLRYGFAKTSMKDLAQAAGLSRQGLYLHFGSKDSIFEAMVAGNLRDAGGTVRRALRRADCSIEDRLAEAFEVAHGAGIGSPLLDELIEESRKRCPLAVGAFETTLLSEVTEALSVAQVADRWKAEKLSAAELAQHLVHASVGIKHEVASPNAYRAGIRLAVQIICRSPRGQTRSSHRETDRSIRKNRPMQKTIIITGASDGIGAAAARKLKSLGHTVILVGRSRSKTEAMARELSVPFHLADYATLGDVQRLADELQHYDRIDVLANNAGGIMGNRELTEDGFEKTFQVNHLAPFLLVKLLMPELIASRSTVIQTASEAANMWGGGFDLSDLNNERDYAPQKAYGRAKLANILFTRELDRRHRPDGISAVAFHPGVVRSSFASDTTHFMRFIYHTPLKYLITISPEKAATGLVDLAEGTPGSDWECGGMYANGKPMKVGFKDDGSIARGLWDRSEAMLKPWLGQGQQIVDAFRDLAKKGFAAGRLPRVRKPRPLCSGRRPFR